MTKEIHREENRPAEFFKELERNKQEKAAIAALGDDAVSDYESVAEIVQNRKLNMSDWEKGIMAFATPKCTPAKSGGKFSDFKFYKK